MQFAKSFLAAAAIGLLAGSGAAAETRATGATVTVHDLGEVKVHAYMAPYDMFAIATYIIESDNALVLFDGQMFTPMASDYRAYADELGKPIDRLIVTHAHPDHYLGLVSFEDVPIYALPDTIREIEETGEQTRVARKEMMGDVIPDRVVLPGETLETGAFTVDGIRYDIGSVSGGEHSPMAITRLPDHGVIAVGDTAMTGVHLFLASEFGPWIEVLKDLKADTGYDLVLAGHGGSSDPSVYADNIAYLEKAAALMEGGADAQAFRAGLIEAFPELEMASALDFFLPYLFPDK